MSSESCPGGRDLSELSELIEHAALGIAVYDTSSEFRVLRHNAAFLAMVGSRHAGRASVVGTALHEFLDPASHAEVRRIFERVRDTGEPFRIDDFAAVLLPERSPRYYRWSLTPLRRDGKVTELLATLIEVTELVKARQQAISDRIQLQFLSDMGVALTTSLDLEETLDRAAHLVVPRFADVCAIDVRGEDGVVRRLGLAHVDSSREAELRELARAYPPGWEANHPVGRVMAQRSSFLIEKVTPEALPGLWGDAPGYAVGRRIAPRSLIIAPLLARGLVLGAIGFWSTVSERHFGASDLALAEEIARRAAAAIDNARLYGQAERAAQALKLERDRLRQVLDVLPAGITIADANGQVTMRNAAARTMWHQAAPASISGSHGSIGALQLDGTPFTSHELPLARSVLQGEVVRGTQLLIHDTATGSSRPVLIDSAPLRDADGTVMGGVAVFQDISPLKELERQKDEFLAAASHDLRTPLAGIRLRAEVIKRRLAKIEHPEMPEVFRELGAVTQITARAAALINQLLDIARFQMGKPIELERRPVNLVELAVQAVCDAQQATTRHKFTIDAPAHAIIGRWDGNRLERVLANLLSNAVKFSPDGGEIQVRLERLEGDSGPEALVTIRDPGLGIPLQEQSFVFRRFYRASNIASRIEGTGIGLAGAKQVIEQHGGSISLSSEPGRGTTFAFRLPLELLGQVT